MLALHRPVLPRRHITRVPWLPICTALASVVALVAIGNLATNWLDVYLVFFGDQPQIRAADVAAYRVWGGIAALALMCGLAAHLLNRRRRWVGTVWQALLLLVGAAILVLCYIPGAVHLPMPEQDDDGYGHGAPPCYSGGDNEECIGG